MVGGFDGYNNLKSFECYNPITGQWRLLPDMGAVREGCGVACLGGLVYAVGGYDGRTFLKSAECYDPVVEEWQPLPDMSEARCGCAAVSLE